VALCLLNHIRNIDRFRTDQAGRRWKPRAPRLAENTRIGLMGLGQIGQMAAETLMALNFPVSGWSRTPRKIDGVRTFAGAGQYEAFLSGADGLVCMLPLTPETRGILNHGTFERLPKGAYLVNVGRGGHLAEEDLIPAIDAGRLSGAALDVFENEPLPEDHPFWGHPKIRVTPHISGLTHPRAVVAQLLENYRRVMNGEVPGHMVDRRRGY
jgi:glyoxylate/hydroxypyruvate reductase A